MSHCICTRKTHREDLAEEDGCKVTDPVSSRFFDKLKAIVEVPVLAAYFALEGTCGADGHNVRLNICGKE